MAAVWQSCDGYGRGSDQDLVRESHVQFALEIQSHATEHRAQAYQLLLHLRKWCLGWSVQVVRQDLLETWLLAVRYNIAWQPGACLKEPEAGAEACGSVTCRYQEPTWRRHSSDSCPWQIVPVLHRYYVANRLRMPRAYTSLIEL